MSAQGAGFAKGLTNDVVCWLFMFDWVLCTCLVWGKAMVEPVATWLPS